VVAAAHDPLRRFGTVNCRIAKGSFDHLVGTGELRQWNFKGKCIWRLEVITRKDDITNHSRLEAKEFFAQRVFVSFLRGLHLATTLVFRKMRRLPFIDFSDWLVDRRKRLFLLDRGYPFLDRRLIRALHLIELHSAIFRRLGPAPTWSRTGEKRTRRCPVNRSRLPQNLTSPASNDAVRLSHVGSRGKADKSVQPSSAGWQSPAIPWFDNNTIGAT
jgi:hypothetical protein